MHARVTTAKGKPGTVDEAIRAVRESLLPAAKQQKGFKGFVLLVDRAGNRSLGVTLWETEEDLQASEGASGYYRDQMAKMADFLEGAPQRDVYEVAIAEF